jgi:hypothetical protein
MKNIKKQIKRELNDKLVSGVIMNLGGLKKQKQKKLIRYLESKMGSVTNYYISLLNKKAKKGMLSPEPDGEMEIVKLRENGSMAIEINTEMIN